jgi:hypothetical protein
MAWLERRELGQKCPDRMRVSGGSARRKRGAPCLRQSQAPHRTCNNSSRGVDMECRGGILSCISVFSLVCLVLTGCAGSPNIQTAAALDTAAAGGEQNPTSITDPSNPIDPIIDTTGIASPGPSANPTTSSNPDLPKNPPPSPSPVVTSLPLPVPPLSPSPLPLITPSPTPSPAPNCPTDNGTCTNPPTDPVDDSCHIDADHDRVICGDGSSCQLPPQSNQECREGRILFCMVPPGNPGQQQTKCLPAPAVHAKLRNSLGYLGRCIANQ